MPQAKPHIPYDGQSQRQCKILHIYNDSYFVRVVLIENYAAT